MASSIPPNKRQKRQDYLAAAKAMATTELPKKKFYRQRAHANPFSDHQLTYPTSPDQMDWSPYFPAYVSSPTSSAADSGHGDGEIRPLIKPVTAADVGCGFGGLLVALSPLLADELILGLEIRTQVHDFTSSRIAALRTQYQATPPATSHHLYPHDYQNIASLRANTMKFLPNFFHKAQLTRLFLCFPDPHFKNRKHKARIVSTTLIAEYAYVMKEGGWVYVITDVKDLFEWIAACFNGNAAEGGEQGGDGGGGRPSELWEEVPEDEREADICIRAVMETTEEGKKVERNRGEKFVACWRRKRDPEWPV